MKISIAILPWIIRLSTLQHLAPEVRSLQVLLVFCLISAYELGPGPISWFIAAELFDQPGRPIAMAFTSMLNWGGKFVLALLFPPLLVGLQCWAFVPYGRAERLGETLEVDFVFAFASLLTPQRHSDHKSVQSVIYIWIGYKKRHKSVQG